MRASKGKHHISGAERIVSKGFLEETVNSLIRRALTHSRGIANSINLKIERIEGSPERISLLDIFEISDRWRYSVEEIILKLLLKVGVKEEVALNAYRSLMSGASPDGTVMRGAMLVQKETGKRLEPDRFRGIRATYMDFTEKALEEFRDLVGKKFNENFRDAVVLSSKVLNCRGIIAELCISDDPEYTTGYISLKGLGYVRIPDIKEKGWRFGGRAFFVDGCGNVEEIRNYLEKKAVLIDRVSSYTLASLMDILSF